MGGRAVCSQCGESAEESAPSTWNLCWGDAPQWAHTDGEPLCPEMGPNGYQPCRVEFI